MRFLKILAALTIVLFFVYWFGPHPATPIYSSTLPSVPSDPIALINYVQQEESKHQVKKDNQAEIIWADSSTKHKTAYSIVYLHGFSASKMEGAPTHEEIAKKFGCNLYLARLSQHGIDTTDALVNMTADNLWESAKQAYAIGKQLGEKVILMGTSTGGTLALQLAAAYPDVTGLILYSPNIAINDPNAWLLNNPWGLQIARLVKGSNYNIIKADAVYSKYWNTKYRLEAVASVEELLETKMTESTFQSIKQPVLTLYYYKDEQNQDPVVKVSAAKKMFEQLATSKELKRAIAMPNTGNHVIGSPILSKDVTGVQQETIRFMQEIMHMNAIK
ncbi:MAG: alpha/beta hydrolase [Bacteroidota bacterium]